MTTLAQINSAVEESRAVTHPLIRRLSHNPNDRLGWQRFAAQHHHIVKAFPHHIQQLFIRLDPETATRLHPVLSDEFPPGTLASAGDEAPDFSAHAGLQLELCRSLGIQPDERALPAVDRFVTRHRTIATVGEIDFALGVFGPGHEAAVPMMFRQLVSGSPPYVNPRYMFEHLNIDVIHAQKFAEVLEEGFDLDQVLAGAMWSLELRAAAWDDILEDILGHEIAKKAGQWDGTGEGPWND